MMDNDELGKWGEKVVAQWGASCGASATVPDKDNHGWDLFLQYPRPKEPGMWGPPPCLTCLLQVKTTRDLTLAKLSIKLSNWLHLVEAPYPAFFVILFVSEQEEVVGAYIVHIGKELIERVLERLSQLDSYEDINHRTLELTWNDSERLNPLKGQNLKAVLEGYVGANLQDYVHDKIAFSRTVGFDGQPISGGGSFVSGTPNEVFSRLASFAIGDIETLAIKDLQMNVTRFGVTKSLFQVEQAEIRRVERPCWAGAALTVQGRSSGDRMTVPGSLVSTMSVFPFLPPEYQRIRFRGRYFTCTLRIKSSELEEANWSFRIPGAREQMQLSEAADAVKLSRILSSGDVEGEIKFQGISISVSGTPEKSNSQQQEAQLIEDAWLVAQNAGIPSGTYVWAGQLVNAYVEIQEVAQCLRGQTNARAVLENIPKEPAFKAGVIVAIRVAWIGDWFVLAYILAKGTIEWRAGATGFDIEMKQAQISVGAVRAVPASQLDSLHSEDLLKKLISSFDGKDVEIFLPPMPPVGWQPSAEDLLRLGERLQPPPKC